MFHKINNKIATTVLIILIPIGIDLKLRKYSARRLDTEKYAKTKK